MMRWTESLNMEYAKHIPYNRRLPEAIEVLANNLYRPKNPTGSIRYASSLVVAERRRFDKNKRHKKVEDNFNPTIGTAIEFIAFALNTEDKLLKPHYLRYAEAELRSLWKLKNE